MSKILITGSDGRFGKVLKIFRTNKKLIFKNKKQLNILSTKSIRRNLLKIKPNYILHLAGLSRPMSIHERDIVKSIDLNIIGTCNIVKEASRLNIKVIYLSTNYVYQGTKGNYNEDDPIKPWNNYGWSKLGGECISRIIPNSLILRCSLCDIPFRHKIAFDDVYRNSITHKDVARLVLKLKEEVGIINVGGEYQSVYEFVSKHQNVKKGSGSKIAPSLELDISKLKDIINE